MPLDLIPILYGAVFACVLLLVEGIYYFVADKHAGNEQQRINRRMQWLSEGIERSVVLSRLRRKTPEELTGMSVGLLRLSIVRKLENLLARAGLAITTIRFLMYMAIGFALTLAILNVTIHVSILLAVLLAAAFAFGLPVFFVARKGRRRIRQMEDQLPEALDMIVRSLRAGHPISAAINLVGREISDPLGSEFGTVADEMTFGIDLQSALENMNARVGFPDMRFVIVTVKVQAQTGGNLSEVLGGLSRLIRERHRLHLKVLALSSEGRFSVKILGGLPFAFFALVSLASPKYFAAIRTDPTLAHIMELGLVMLLIGIYLMRRVVNFRV